MTVPTRARSTPAQRLDRLPELAQRVLDGLDQGVSPTGDVVAPLLRSVARDVPLLLELHKAAIRNDDRTLLELLNRLEGEE